MSKLAKDDPTVVFMTANRGPFRCGHCEYFHESSCELVAGLIAPGDCCNLYEPDPALAKFDASQPRDERGRWAPGGAVSGRAPKSLGRDPIIPPKNSPMVAWNSPDPDVSDRVDGEIGHGPQNLQTIEADYALNFRDKPAVYRSYVPLDRLDEYVPPDEPANPEEGEEALVYDWSKYRKDAMYPPIKVQVDPEGHVDVLGGNHRVRYWKQAGFDYAPAVVLDYRPNVVDQYEEVGRSVRKGVNPHEPISASAVLRVRVYVYNADGLLLALRRQRHDDENHNPPGTWEMIQGKVDDGEKIEDAAIRELKEEVGYYPSDLKSWRALTPYVWEAVLDRSCRRKPDLENNPDKEHEVFAWLPPKVALQRMGRRIAKAAIDPIERILRAIAWDDWDSLTKLVAPELGEAASEGVVQGLDTVGLDSDRAFSLANADAVDYAVTRAGALIDPITNTTKAGLRSLLEQALVDGWSGEQLSRAIEDSGMFSADRADRIARTELAMATSQGNLDAWRRSGVVTGKKWIIADTHDSDDVCDENAAAGVIPLDDQFPSGDDGPPAHPNCKCVVVPVTVAAA